MLTIDRHRVDCDVLAFFESMRLGQWRSAIQQFTGYFLHDVRISADERFEHWRDAVNARLLNEYRRCIEGLEEDAEHEDAASVEVWTRLGMRFIPEHVILARLHFRSIAEQGRLEEARQAISEYQEQYRGELTHADRQQLAADLASYSAAQRTVHTKPEHAHEKLKFVGRTAELVKLREIWSRAASGSASVVLLSGDPGIGKTRLLDQVARFAAIRGSRVLLCAASPATSRVPFAGILELFGDVVSRSSGQGKLPQLSRIGSWNQPAPDPGVWEPALYAECEFMARELVVERPLLLAVDDLQWLDESSLQLLVYIAYRCQSQRLLIAMCTRPEGEHILERFRAVVTTYVLRVGPMVEASAEALLASMCQARSAELSRGVRDALLARAGGNPFFLTALADDAIRKAPTDPKAAWSAVPESVSSLVVSRARQLSNAAQDTLRSLAILRACEPVEVIADVGKRSPLRTARALQELVSMRLAVDGPCGIRIAHDVIADVVYYSIPDTVRRFFHSRAAHALRHRGSAVVAGHASRAGDSALAFAAAMDAATQAKAIGAYAEAEFFFSMARAAAATRAQQAEAAAAHLAFVCGVDRFSSALDEVELAATHFRGMGDDAGIVRCVAVELDSAIRAGLRPLSQLTCEASDLVRRAKELGDRRLAAEALSVQCRAVELGNLPGQAADWVAGAIEVAESAEVDWRVTLLGKAAVLSYFAIGPDAAQALSNRLPTLAGDDARLKALSYGYLGVTSMLLGHLSEAEHYYHEALKLAKDPALADAYHKASMNLAVLETDMGRYELAASRLDEDAGGRTSSLVSVANTGFLRIETGDLEGAEAAATELRTRCVTLKAPMAVVAAATLDGLAAWARQDYDGAASHAQLIEPILPCIPFLSDDSYARVLMARVAGRAHPRMAIAILEQSVRRAAVPQLRVDLERALQFLRLDKGAGLRELSYVLERAESIGVAPIAVRAATAMC